MQSQVNYLLTKDCEKDIKKQQRRMSNFVDYKENAKKAVDPLKKKSHGSRKSLLK
jgi:hypothetical protein